MRVAAGVAAAAGLAALGLGCAIQAARPDDARTVEVEAVPVEIAPAMLDGLILRGSVELTANHAAFGGISGMLIRRGTLLAVSDRGWLLRSRLADDAGGLRPLDAALAPLLDAGGGRLERSGRDAESLATFGGALAVAFERDHRVALIDSGRLARTFADRRLERLGFNQGLEALATLPDGRLLAIAEAPEDGAFPVFLLDETGIAATGALVQSGPHFVTGADIGPDGRLYLLRRDFSYLAGLSIRIERYRLDPNGFPLPETREALAAFESGSGIDNMEAIALWRDEGGRLRLAIASDDNFNLLQRTLLMDFQVMD